MKRAVAIAGTRRAPTAAALAALAVVLAAAAPSSGQVCLAAGERGGREAGVLVGLASYDLADGMDGTELGVEAATRISRFTGRAAVYSLRPESGRTNPLGARVSLGTPVAVIPWIRTCVAALGGFTRFSTDDADMLTLAGGAAITVQHPILVGAAGVLSPYLTLRGLAGAATGSAIGEPVNVGGLEVGAEGGIGLRYGPIVLRFSAAVDGFDPGLGTTAFPHRAYRVMAGLAF